MTGIFVITDAQVEYSALDKSKAFKQGDKSLYLATLLLSKDNKEAIEALEAAAIQCVKAKNEGEVPADYDLGIRDGDEKDNLTDEYKKSNPAFRDVFYINAKTKC